jgi:KaiC/GvpD/RAD55 family RecA-like ATPase
MPRDFEIETPEEIAQCSSGISGLDYQLGGGIPAGTSLVVYGNPLAGIDRMAKQFWKADDNHSSYLMFDATPEEGMIDIVGKQCNELSQFMEGDRIVIDSLSTVIFNEGIDVAIKFMSSDIAGVKERNGNVLFLLYDNLHDPLDLIRIMRAADIFISLKEENHQNEIERKLAIHKIPYMDVPTRIYPYIIRDFGLELSTTARVV